MVLLLLFRFRFRFRFCFVFVLLWLFCFSFSDCCSLSRRWLCLRAIFHFITRCCVQRQALQIIITKTTNTEGNKSRLCICTVICWPFNSACAGWIVAHRAASWRSALLHTVDGQIGGGGSVSIKWTQCSLCIHICIRLYTSAFIVIYETLYVAWCCNRWQLSAQCWKLRSSQARNKRRGRKWRKNNKLVFCRILCLDVR